MMSLLKSYWLVFFRRLPHFLVVTLVISALSLFVALKLPPVFISQTRIIVEAPRIPTELAASTVLTPSQEQLQLIEQRLMTRANLISVADKFQIFENQSELLPGQIVAGMHARTNIRSSSGRDEVAMMTLTFESDSAEKAAGVLNEYLRLIQEEDERSRAARAGQTLEFFEGEVSRLFGELSQRSAAMRSFLDENRDALPETLEYRLTQQTQLQERLAQLERDVAGLDDQRERLLQIFEATGEVSGMPTTTPAQTPEQRQLEALRADLSQALAVYTPENPRVKLLQAQVTQLEKAISVQPIVPDAGGASTGNPLLDVQLAEFATRREILDEQRVQTAKQLEDLTDTINRTPANAIALEDLQRDYDNIQLQYNAAVERMSLASTGERIETLERGQRITVIEPPVVPDNPSKPNRKRIAVGGGFVGILLGLGLVVVLDIFDPKIRRPEVLASKLGIMPLAVIPYIQHKSPWRWVSRIIWLLVIVLGILGALFVLRSYYQPLDLIVQRVMTTLGLN